MPKKKATAKKPQRPREMLALKKHAPLVMAVVVGTQPERDAAGEMLATFQIARRKVEKSYRALLDPLNEVRGVVLEMRREDLALTKPCEAHLQRVCGDWDAEVERKAGEAATALLPAAIDTATQERKDDIQDLQDLGQNQEAITLAQKPIIPDVSSVISVAPTVTPGFSKGADGVEIIVTDMKNLCLAIGNGLVSPDAVSINETHFRGSSDHYQRQPAPGVIVQPRRGKIVFRGGSSVT